MPPTECDPLAGRIFTIRGQRVILDADLARLYGTTTKRFNEAFKRNVSRFPADFCFQLKTDELSVLRSQFATSNMDAIRKQTTTAMWSKFVTTSEGERRGGPRSLPWAFTEHGAVMAANVLRSPKAVEMSVYVVRAFIKQRELLATNTTILKRLAEIDKTLLEHNSALLSLWRKLQPLLVSPPEKPRRPIGCHAIMKK